jgi:hypothetical protein
MEASVDPQPRGPDWMPITPKTGSLFHAETHLQGVEGTTAVHLCFVSPERIVLAPDCGMKYLPRDVAFGKLEAMAQAAAILRREFREL